MDFITRLKEELKKIGITKTELAREIGIPEANIRNWERGSQPSLDKVIKISQYLNISIDELCGNIIKNKNESIQAAYNAADPGTQAAVRKLLDIEEQKYVVKTKSSDLKIG